MKEMLKFLKPYLSLLLIATLATAVSAVCDLLLPSIMSDILNRGVYQKDISYIAACCGKMLVVSVLGLGAVLLSCHLSAKVVAKFCADMRKAVFQKVHAMSFEEFSALGTSALVTRATNDVETVSWLAAEMAGTVFMIPVLFLGGVFLSMKKDVMLSLTLLAFVPVILVIVLLVGNKIRPLWVICDEYIDKQNGLMRDRLRGIRVIRAFNAEAQAHEDIAQATHEMARTMIASNVSMGLITPLVSFLLNFATVLIVYLGTLQIEKGSALTGADIFAIVQYVALVSNAVIMGAFSIIMLPHAKVAADRIGQVLHAKGMADPAPRREVSLQGEICFQNVSFQYEGAAEPAVENVSFAIKSGENVAIIGGTGSGKTTMVSLLLGFRVPTGGKIELDGISSLTLSRHEIRESVSCVLQTGMLYSGTVAGNLRMGNERADSDAMWRALEDAQAADFVRECSKGLEHEIKQSGKNFSGGQKQRLCIARALLKDAPVYIFDDSFSALDFLTEARLRKALNVRLQGKTRITVTQRVSSAMHCDRIFVMDEGRLVSSGTHSELLESCPVYQGIYASQTGGERHAAE